MQHVIFFRGVNMKDNSGKIFFFLAKRKPETTHCEQPRKQYPTQNCAIESCGAVSFQLGCIIQQALPAFELVNSVLVRSGRAKSINSHVFPGFLGINSSTQWCLDAGPL